MSSSARFHVLHATDFSRTSEAAFAHALAVALIHEADLTLLHAGSLGREGTNWDRFPEVRRRLAAWGLLPQGADRSAVARTLGVYVHRVVFQGRDPTRQIMEAIETRAPNFVVLGKRRGNTGWGLVRRSVSETLARAAVVPTLVIPGGSPGFVSLRDGSLSLARVLVGVDSKPDPRAAIAEAANILRFLAPDGVEVELFHAGTDATAPYVPDDVLPNAQVRRVSRPGSPAEEIVRRAREIGADLIVLATEGHAGDALRGSVTERVLNRSSMAVLAVPAT